MVIKTQKSQSIIDFLKQDLLINLNIIGIIENVPEAEIYVDNIDFSKGVFVKKHYFHYIYTKGDNFIDEIANKFFKEEGNKMSPGLAKKCGFVECEHVDWFGIKV
ncbi:MAG: hypothetical protein PWQ37_888 [Candidatus Petromonas sp.]|jgi:predicted transcriptional regulator|nr:hypothetical protein [Candidatus Petromonas sp.]